VRRSSEALVLVVKGRNTTMKLTHNRRSMLVVSLSLSLASSVTAARPAVACGGYGQFALTSEERAGQRVSQYLSALVRRNAAEATAAFTADARAHNDHHGCCPPPSFTAAQWVSMRLADRTYRVTASSAATAQADGSFVLQIRSQSGGVALIETVTLRDEGGVMRIASLSSERASWRA
jgi:hypothetical protein